MRKTQLYLFFRVLVMAVVVVLSCTATHAQKRLKVDDFVDFNFQIANNHLWRGIEVSDGLVMCTTLSFHDKAQHFRLGCWGGTNTSGNYKEFNFFGEISTGGWKLALWDTYNFSSGADYNNQEFFNYSARTTGRFLDCILSYNFEQAISRLPLSLTWSTILFGRDRWDDNSANRYSCYVSAEYPVFRDKEWRFDVSVGGTFTLSEKDGDNSTFYSDKAGIIHLQLRAERSIQLSKEHSIPVFACAVFNPVMDKAFFQVGVKLHQ